MRKIDIAAFIFTVLCGVLLVGTIGYKIGKYQADRWWKANSKVHFTEMSVGHFAVHGGQTEEHSSDGKVFLNNGEIDECACKPVQ